MLEININKGKTAYYYNADSEEDVFLAYPSGISVPIECCLKI